MFPCFPYCHRGYKLLLNFVANPSTSLHQSVLDSSEALDSFVITVDLQKFPVCYQLMGLLFAEGQRYPSYLTEIDLHI